MNDRSPKGHIKPNACAGTESQNAESGPTESQNAQLGPTESQNAELDPTLGSGLRLGDILAVMHMVRRSSVTPPPG